MDRHARAGGGEFLAQRYDARLADHDDVYRPPLARDTACDTIVRICSASRLLIVRRMMLAFYRIRSSRS